MINALTFITRALPIAAALFFALFLYIALNQRDSARAERGLALRENAAYAQLLETLQARHEAELAALADVAAKARNNAALVAEQKEKINAQDGFESSVRAALDGVRDIRAMRAGRD